MNKECCDKCGNVFEYDETRYYFKSYNPAFDFSKKKFVICHKCLFEKNYYIINDKNKR